MTQRRNFGRNESRENTAGNGELDTTAGCEIRLANIAEETRKAP